MNKKRWIWLVVAMAVFCVTSWVGIASAKAYREAAASLGDTYTELIGSLGISGETITGNDYPEEPFIARVDIVDTIQASADATSVLSGSASFDLDGLISYINELATCENNVGLLLYINSPGGEMNATDELYLTLMDYKEATGRPIYAYFDDYGCSGAYYVAMAADKIYANRNSLCVNIGVYLGTYDVSELFEKLGVKTMLFKSSENKGIGATGVEWTEEQIAIYQSIVDIYYDQFLEVVAEGRGLTKEEVKEKNDGREMLAKQALEVGLIDGICRWGEYEEMVMEWFGCDNIYEQTAEESSLLDSLSIYFSSLFPKSESESLLSFAEKNSGMKVMAYDINY